MAESKQQVRETRNSTDCKNTEIFKMLSSLFAHPFIITLLASGVLVYIGEAVKDTYVNKNNQNVYLKEMTNKKYALLTDFTSKCDKELSLLYNFKIKKSWLLDKRNSIDPVGRNRKEVLTFCEKLWADYEKEHTSESLLIQIASVYDNATVVNRADKLLKLIEDFQEKEYTGPDATKVIFNKVDIIYDEMNLLSKDMGNEIKGEIKSYTKKE